MSPSSGAEQVLCGYVVILQSFWWWAAVYCWLSGTCTAPERPSLGQVNVLGGCDGHPLMCPIVCAQYAACSAVQAGVISHFSMCSLTCAIAPAKCASFQNHASKVDCQVGPEPL